MAFIATGRSVFYRPETLREQLARLIRTDGALAAHYIPGIGVTGALNASLWANSFGFAGAAADLAQATSVAQPVVLSWTGTNYAYLGTVTDNYYSSPSAAANQIVGDIEIIYSILLEDWTPVTAVSLPGKWDAGGAGNGGYTSYIKTDGTIVFQGDYVISGSVSATSDDVTGFTDATTGYIKITRVKTTGVVTFWTSVDGITYVQNGAPKTAAPNEAFKTTSAMVAGGKSLVTNPGIIRLFSFTVANAIGGSPVVDFNPALATETTTNGATFVAATGETWTLNNTGATPAQIVGSPQLLTNGTSHYMMATFTLNQPFTLYFVGKEITWVSNARIIGGATAECDLFQQNAGVSPNLKMYAGTTFAPLIGPALNINAILTAVFSGASSLFTLNAAAAQTGDIGTANPGGIILAAYRTLIAYGNIQIKELIVRSVADSAATRLAIQQRLATLHGISL